jgi:hypothetical protein
MDKEGKLPRYFGAQNEHLIDLEIADFSQYSFEPFRGFSTELNFQRRCAVTVDIH